jgi:hypothetical protein
MTRAGAHRVAKPYPGFPLARHPNGQWCKKIKGRLHHFGLLADWQDALDLFQEQKDHLWVSVGQ